MSDTNVPFDQDEPETEPAVEAETGIVEPVAETDEDLICGQAPHVFLAVLISGIALFVATLALMVAVRVRNDRPCAIPLIWNTPTPHMIQPPIGRAQPGAITPYVH